MNVDWSQYWNKLLGRTDQLTSTDVSYWERPDHSGWLMKQGEFLSSWRRRYFVLKDGHLFWFLGDFVSRGVVPRGVIKIGRCVSIKGAEEVLNKPYSFEISTADAIMYFVADSEREKEEWINSVGKAIVRQSQSVLSQEIQDYS